MIQTWRAQQPQPLSWLGIGLVFSGVAILLILSQLRSEWLAGVAVVVGIGVFVITSAPRQAFMIYVALIPVFSIVASQLSGYGATLLGSSFSTVSAIKDVLLIMLVLGWGGSVLQHRRPIRAPHVIWVIGFQTVALLQVFRSADLSVGLLAFRNVFEFSLLYILATDLLHSDEDITKLLKFILVVGVVVQAYGLWDWILKGTSIAVTFTYHYMGRLTIFGDYSSAGSYAIFTIILLTINIAYWGTPQQNKRFGLVLLLGLILAGTSLVLSFERRGWLGSLLSMVFVFALSRKFRVLSGVIFAIGVATAVIYFAQPDLLDLIRLRLSDDLGRSNIWAIYWPRVLDSQFMGEGLGTANNALNSLSGYYEFTPHNYYLLLLVQGGIPLLAAFSLMVAALAWHGGTQLSRPISPSRRLAVIIALSVLFVLLSQSFFADFLETFPVNAYFWLFAGLCVADE